MHRACPKVILIFHGRWLDKVLLACTKTHKKYNYCVFTRIFNVSTAMLYMWQKQYTRNNIGMNSVNSLFGVQTLSGGYSDVGSIRHVTDVPLVVLCLSSCLQNTQCASFFYNENKKLCHLNEYVFFDNSTFTPEDHWKYYMTSYGEYNIRFILSI